MIQPARIHDLNEKNEADKPYVLYWMQASQRTRFNHALEYSIQRANDLKLPLLVCFGLMDDYPEANARHYAFMLQGLRDVEIHLKNRDIKFVVKHGNPPDVALHYAKHAALVICDWGYTRHQKRWRDQVADEANVKVVQVESDVVIPVEEVSDKHEYAARTIRPKIHRKLADYLVVVKPTKVLHSSLNLDIAGNIDPTDPDKLLEKLKVDRSVPPSSRFEGGEIAAARALKLFIAKKLGSYAVDRNEPSAGGTSTMSPYLHFGHISPIEIALAVRDHEASPKEDRDAYLEELIVRRELSINYVHFCPKYDSYDQLPDWAKKALEQHRHDERPEKYSLKELEEAKTTDAYWNAAQLEMTRTGFMHNYMRMYWGKKILEWSPDAKEAFARTLYLNNKYFIDGRDPNAYANVAWIYGLHDRPWGPARKIFGTIRYMNAAGLKRKFDMDAYVKWVSGLA